MVTEMSWHYPDDEDLDYETRLKRQNAAVRELAQELTKEPETLEGHLDLLSRVQPSEQLREESSASDF